MGTIVERRGVEWHNLSTSIDGSKIVEEWPVVFLLASIPKRVPLRRTCYHWLVVTRRLNIYIGRDLLVESRAPVIKNAPRPGNVNRKVEDILPLFLHSFKTRV